MTMVPEAWQNDQTMVQDKKDFYNWSAFAMEPWDGPGRILSSVYIHVYRIRVIQCKFCVFFSFFRVKLIMSPSNIFNSLSYNNATAHIIYKAPTAQGNCTGKN